MALTLYNFGLAANGRRVAYYLAEKGLDIPTEEVLVREGALFKEPLASMNPFKCVPFMTLDDGTVISESMAICRYLEELHPEPSLMGSTPQERAVIEMWNRRVELDGMVPAVQAIRNKVPMFAGRVVAGTRTDLEQSPTIVERGIATLHLFLKQLEPQLSENQFIAGDAFSVADITGYITIGAAAGPLEIDIAGEYPNVDRWFQEMKARPGLQSGA